MREGGGGVELKWGMGRLVERKGGVDLPLPPTEMGNLLSSFAGAVGGGAVAVTGGIGSDMAMAGKCGGGKEEVVVTARKEFQSQEETIS